MHHGGDVGSTGSTGGDEGRENGKDELDGGGDNDADPSLRDVEGMLTEESECAGDHGFGVGEELGLGDHGLPILGEQGDGGGGEEDGNGAGKGSGVDKEGKASLFAFRRSWRWTSVASSIAQYHL